MAQIIKGSYVSTGVAVAQNLVIDPDFIEVWIQGDATGSNWNSVANPAVVKLARWFKGMANGSAFTIENTAGAATDQATFLTTNGFTVYDGSNQTPGAPIGPGTGISQAAAAVVTINAHGLVTGDRVVLYSCTGMRQVEGMTFTVTRTGANTFTIPCDTSAFVAPATAVTARRLPAIPQFGPRSMYITGITQANPMVVSMSETNPYHVGGKVRLNIPTGFGMQEANGLIGTITAVAATSITLNIDSSGFTAFAFPVTGAVPFTFAKVVPVGEDATTLADAITNGSFRGVVFGTSVVGPNAANVYFTATKADAVV